MDHWTKSKPQNYETPRSFTSEENLDDLGYGNGVFRYNIKGMIHEKYNW